MKNKDGSLGVDGDTPLAQTAERGAERSVGALFNAPPVSRGWCSSISQSAGLETPRCGESPTPEAQVGSEPTESHQEPAIFDLELRDGTDLVLRRVGSGVFTLECGMELVTLSTDEVLALAECLARVQPKIAA